MHLIGRWERVRPVGAGGVGPAYVLDRKWGELSPVGIADGWWRSPAGVWRRVGPTLYDQRGAFSATLQYPRVLVGLGSDASSGQATIALSSSYTYASAGNGIAARLSRATASTLNNVYFYISSYTGTASLVDDIDFEFRNNSSNLPGTTLHASASINPSSATGWIKITGLSFAASASVDYWAIVADADGGGTNFATVMRNASPRPANFPANYSDHCAYSSTNGFTSASNVQTISTVVTNWSDGATLGNPFAASVSSSSNTSNQRGLLLGGLSGQIKLFGIVCLNQATQYSGANVWSGSNGPGGTADIATTTSALSCGQAASQGYRFTSPPILRSGTTYRVVFTYSGNNAVPNKFKIGTGADANLKAAMFGGGAWYWSEANGTTDWSNDDTAAFPDVALIVEDLFGYPYVGAGLAGGYVT